MTFLALLLTACGPAESVDLGPRGSCDPVDPGLCALPFPSDFFTVEDASTVTGLRVDFAEDTLPMDRDGYQVRPDLWNERDGFGIGGTLLAYFEDLAWDGLVTHEDIGASLEDGATTILVDTSTGERVAHWAEIDASSPDPDAPALLILHTAAPLDWNTRYVVGIRGLVKEDGSPVDVSPGFAALRDGTPSDDPDVERQRDAFEEGVFPALEPYASRDELQLAWTFTTASRESTLGRMISIRDDAHAWVDEQQGGIPYTITSVEDDDCSEEGVTIGRTIEGVFTAPLYTEDDAPYTFLTRGDDGLPYRNGTTQVDFLVRVPCSLLEDPHPGFLLQYGHGLLGDRSEARTGYLSEMADRYGWVIVAVDWTGMSEEDVDAIMLMAVTEPSDFGIVPERSQQGFVEQDLALRFARQVLPSDPNLQVDGVPLIDPDRYGYYGNSQGAVLGGGYLGMSQQLHRGVLGVGGAPYTLLLPRSYDFTPWFMLFQAKYLDHRDIQLYITLMGMLWEPAEAIGWTDAMQGDPVTGSPAKDVLLQVAIGDAQVNTLGAHVLARAYGAYSIAPQNRAIWGVPEQEAAGEPGSAIVEWLYEDGPEEPFENVPPDVDRDTHECPRREPAAQDQLRAFVEDGVIEQYCDGPCTGVREGFCD